MRAVALTTSDNPYNPFDDYAKWHSWDTLHGYNTPGYLARVARTVADLYNSDSVEPSHLDKAASVGLPGLLTVLF